MSEQNYDRRRLMLLLHAALDGELDAAGMLDFERLLAKDKELAANYERLVRLRATLRAKVPKEAAPESLRSQLVAALDDQLVERIPANSNVRPASSPSWRAFAGAIAATVVLTLGAERFLTEPNDPLQAALQDAVSAHRRGQISGNPTDIASSDHHTVKPWLASKLPVSTALADLAGDGFPLVGGRIDLLAGEAAPTLVYQRRQHLISVTETTAHASAYPATPKRLTVNGYTVFIWSDGSRGFTAASDLAPDEFSNFVDLFRNAIAKETVEPR